METIDYSVIFRYGLEMTITLLISFGLYLLKVKASTIQAKDWLRANGLNIGISFAVAWLLAVGIETSPGITGILGALGFAADQSAAAMALVIAGLTLSATNEPSGGQNKL